MSYIGISFAFIALAVLLGFFVSREKVKNHQMVGIAFATVGILMLSYIS